MDLALLAARLVLAACHRMAVRVEALEKRARSGASPSIAR